VIEVTGLRKAYAGRVVLNGVDLAVGPGEIVALLGPNGAGKTTTVEIIEGFRAPDRGSARVLGEDPRRGGPGLRARVGLMLQDGAGLEPRATARDLLRLYAAFHEGARPAHEVLNLVGLAPVADTRVRRLSGGERQRLSLALALIGDPEVLVLDEPTAGMDPAARRDTRDLIAGLRGEGRAILLTTHDLGDVERLADRVAILYGGRIVADAPPDKLTEGNSTAVSFAVDAPPPPDALERLAARLRRADPPIGLQPAQHGGPGDGDRRFEIEPGVASADLVLEVAQWAAREGLLVTELRSGTASLEERYLELTGDHDVEDVA
jgi:ABC-2 type transport system ATP-binding protein